MGSPVYRDSAVVLRTYRLAEADRIVVLMTEHHGKVRAVAKGVRKTMSKFGARLEPMSHVQLLLAHGRTDLDIVSQAESIETLAPLVADLDHMTNGMAMLEAVDQLALEREPAPHLYRMLVGALRTVARALRPAGRAGVLLEAAGRRGHHARCSTSARAAASPVRSSPSTWTRAARCAATAAAARRSARRRWS